MPKKIPTPLFDFAKKQKLYHFNHDQADDNDIVFKPKFKGEWTEEIDRFQGKPNFFDTNRKFTRMQLEEWNNLEYDIEKSFFFKMQPNDTTPKIKNMIDSVPFDQTENIQSVITEQRPGQYIPYHMDLLASSNIETEKVLSRGMRIIIFLTDWMPGEFMMWGTTTIQKWKAGHILGWPAAKYPHGTANVSHHAGYRARLSGLATQETRDWLNSDEIIGV